jgi:hypothetical protein
VESQLFGVKPTDPAIAAATMLLTTAALALPSSRPGVSPSVNPMDALRFD